jgi:hypothetical protein
MQNGLGVNYVIPTTLDVTATIPTANASLFELIPASERLIFNYTLTTIAVTQHFNRPK